MVRLALSYLALPHLPVDGDLAANPSVIAACRIRGRSVRAVVQLAAFTRRKKHLLAPVLSLQKFLGYLLFRI